MRAKVMTFLPKPYMQQNTEKQTMDKRFKYRLITGKDDANFCERISNLIKEGYEPHGSPSVTFNGKDVIAAQAMVLPEGPKITTDE